MIEKAYAKINIALNVLSKQSDGYHQLDMVMLPLELHDTLEIELAPTDSDTIIAGPGLEVITTNNLAAIAVDKMRDFYHFKENFLIRIQKRIPMAAGLGGGSSDAAAVVRAINKLLKLNAEETDIMNICRSLGSDVPFFYHQTAARVQGTGEILTPISVRNNYQVLIIKPKEGLSTKSVFAKYDENPAIAQKIEPVIKALTTGDDKLLTSAIFNQLQNAAEALCPDITAIIKTLHSDGFDIVQMSGSGSSVFVLSKHASQLKPAAVKYDKSGYEVIVTQLKARTI